jgi:hypothetical protein
VVCSCEHSNEPLCAIKGRDFLTVSFTRRILLMEVVSFQMPLFFLYLFSQGDLN